MESSTLNPKPLATLEYDKIIQRLAGLTETAAGRELALDLLPSSSFPEVVRRQRLTAEARKLRQMKPNLSLAAARDVRQISGQAALGHVLSPAELLDIEATLSLAGSVAETISRLRVHLPLLAEIASAEGGSASGGDRIADCRELIAEINRCLNPRAEVADAASPVLAQLRRDARQAHDRLYDRLQRLINSPLGRQALQEPIVTLRDGRYVIPVRAELRGLIPGIVHDVSSSGATVFLEPLEVVEMGNAWRELQLEEEREVLRILRDLSARVGQQAEAIVAAVDALAEMDLSLAKARLGEAMACHHLPYPNHNQSWLARSPHSLRLVNARHPLLSGHVVPITVWVGGRGTRVAGHPHPSPLPRGRGKGEGGKADGFTVLLITGPNTGGKTVALKTVGLLALMAQAGLAVPADRGTRLPVFDAVYADIGDEQSIEQSLSTFSSHMGNIISILQEATSHSLVLLDELGAGTDPTEGSALAQAIVKHLLQAGCLALATTHHSQLKVFAHITPGVMNASVEFDPETLAPTYHLSIGLPGQSNALAIAQRLGLPQPILEEACQALPGGHLDVESLLVDLQRQRQAAATARRAQEDAASEAEALRRQLESRLAVLEADRQRAMARVRQEMEREVMRARKRLQKASKELERPDKLGLEGARQLIRSVEEQVEKLERRRRRWRAPLPPIQAGDLVWLRDLSQPGEALSAPTEVGEVEVRLGALRARIKLADIERVEKRDTRQETRDTGPSPRVSSPVSRVAPDLNVRGMIIEEALPIIDRRLDEAFRAGLSQVRIVHGKGTGALRRAVREMLSQHPLVKSLSAAPPQEGGDGVTVVELAG